VQSNFVRIDYSHNLAHFISVILRGDPMSSVIFLIAYIGFLAAACAFLFARKEAITVLHVAGLIAALPTFCWFWQDYYNIVMVLPALIAVSVVWRMQASLRQKIVQTCILVTLLATTQVISGTGKLHGFLQIPLPSLLVNPVHEMQMEYWP